MENWQNEYITENNNTDLLNKELFDELLVKYDWLFCGNNY